MGSRQGGLYVFGVDPDAASFVARCGGLTAVQIAAVNRFVLMLKELGLWQKLVACYPFVGGTAAAHAQNLMSASYVISWFGGLTHSDLGVKGNGSTGYGDTGVPGDSTGAMDGCAGVYVGELPTAGTRAEMGYDVLGDWSRIFGVVAGSFTNTRWQMHGSVNASATLRLSLGLNMVARNESAQSLGQSRDDVVTVVNPVGTPSAARRWALFSTMSGVATWSFFSNSRQQLAFIGQYLNPAQRHSLSVAVDLLQSDLGRSV